MLVLADFVLESDLCLPEHQPRLVIRREVAGFEAVLSNIKTDAPTGAELACRLVVEAPEFEAARSIANEAVARLVNCLAYATNRKFMARELLRLIQWDTGLALRKAVIFHTGPADDRCQPALDTQFVGTAERLLAMQKDPHQATAMRWYRLGIQSISLEEQFAYFWFALEIAAQVLKRPERINSKCPRCREKLYCEKCGDYPTHRPYPMEAIRQLVERVHPDGGQEAFEVLQKIRHTVMHGDRIDSIAGDLPCTSEQAINTLVAVTWHALQLMFSAPDPAPQEPMTYGDPETFVRKSLVAGVDIETSLLRDHDNPQIENFPKIDFTVTLSPSRPPPQE